MAKFWGKIGINRGPRETAPGIFEQFIEEVTVAGEVRTLGARWQNHELGGTVSARHVLSIITPEDSAADFNEVVYVWWNGRKWSVRSIEYKRPRIELMLGGKYNG